jgi:hypothetical protein
MELATFTQIVGWIGTFLIVLAYYLVSSKRLEGTNKLYQLMNLFGAIGLGINVLYQQAWPSVALQTVWGAIAVLALLKKTKPANGQAKDAVADAANKQ